MAGEQGVLIRAWYATPICIGPMGQEERRIVDRSAPCQQNLFRIEIDAVDAVFNQLKPVASR